MRASIHPSASKNGTPKRRESWRPMVDLPTPGMPTRAINPSNDPTQCGFVQLLANP